MLFSFELQLNRVHGHLRLRLLQTPKSCELPGLLLGCCSLVYEIGESLFEPGLYCVAISISSNTTQKQHQQKATYTC